MQLVVGGLWRPDQEAHDVCSSLPWRQRDQGCGTQGTRCLSVVESEFYAGVKGGTILLGAKYMMIDIGENVAQCVLDVESCSANRIMERRWAGRIRHLHCPMLWLQERVDSGEIRTEKRKG